MKIHITGPMIDIPQFNFPQFQLATGVLRKLDYEVVSPHEQDTPEVQEIAWNSEHGDPRELPSGFTIETAVRNVADVGICDGMALLQGWPKSLGSRMEVEAAHRFGIPVAPIELWMAINAEEAEAAFATYGEMFSVDRPSWVWRHPSMGNWGFDL